VTRPAARICRDVALPSCYRRAVSKRLVTSLGALLLGSAGCFEDPPPLLDTGEGSTGSSTGGGASTTEVADDTAGQTVTLSGRITSVAVDTGYQPGARVSLIGMPGVETVLDAQGRYTLSGVPVGQVAFLAVEPSVEYAGTVFGVDVGFANVTVPDHTQATRVGIAMSEEAIQSQDNSFAYDPALGHMVSFTPAMAVEVTLEPLPPGAVRFALDINGTPIINQSASLGDPPLVGITNLSLQGEGYYQLMASHLTMTCVVTFPSPPTLADHFTYIEIECA
jgi:hypothetical protein